MKSWKKKISEMKLIISDCAEMKENQSVVANKWARGNSLLVGLISKLRSEARVATSADKMEADEKPDGPKAGDPDLGSPEVCEVFGTAEVDPLD